MSTILENTAGGTMLILFIQPNYYSDIEKVATDISFRAMSVIKVRYENESGSRFF